MKAPKRYNQSALAVLRRSSAFPTLAAMAARVGFRSMSAMQQAESGRREMSEEKLRLLARALGMPLWRVEAAYLSGRRAFLRREAEDIDARLKELHVKAS